MAEDWLISGLIGLISGIVGGSFAAKYLADNWSRIKGEELDALASRFERHLQQERSALGGAKFKENEERLNEALGVLVQKTQEGASITDALKEVATQYPDVAARLAKRFI